MRKNIINNKNYRSMRNVLQAVAAYARNTTNLLRIFLNFEFCRDVRDGTYSTMATF